jgi:nucleotide sugar dehydrogenase
MTKIGIVGLGSLGLPVAIIFGMQYDVIGIDIKKTKIKQINNKILPDNLESNLKDSFYKTKLTVSDDIRRLNETDLVILILPTTDTDFSIIEKVLSELNGFYTGDVIISSTVGVGFTREMQRRYDRIKISYVPIRTFTGKVSEQFTLFPKLIGTFKKETYKRISNFYKKCGCKTISVIPPEKAELAKLFSNAYRNTELAISNELGLITQSFGYEPKEIFNLVNKGDPYRNLMMPGIWGGPCLPKDTKILIKECNKKLNFTPKILVMSEKIRREIIKRKVNEILPTNNKISVGIEGVTFKPIEFGIKETKDSPILDLIKILKSRGVKIKIWDSNISRKKLKKLANELKVKVAMNSKDCSNCDVYVKYEGFYLKIKRIKL